MSEQPTNVYPINSYRRSKPDGSLEMGPETDVSFHESDLLPHREVEQAYQSVQPAQEAEPVTTEFNTHPEDPQAASRILIKLTQIRKHETNPSSSRSNYEEAA